MNTRKIQADDLKPGVVIRMMSPTYGLQPFSDCIVEYVGPAGVSIIRPYASREPPVCAYCHQVVGHSSRCSVTRFGAVESRTCEFYSKYEAVTLTTDRIVNSDYWHIVEQ